MITPINSINTNSFNGANNTNSSFKKCKVKLLSGEYPIKVIRGAKRIVEKANSDWEKVIYDNIRRQIEDTHYAILTGKKTKKDKGFDRFNLDVITMGMSEILYFIPRTVNDKVRADACFTYISKIVTDLTTIQLKEIAAIINKKKVAKRRELGYIEDQEKIYPKIKSEILDLFQRQSEGNPTSMPKNIMFVHKDSTANKNLMDRTKEEANANVITCDARQWVQEDSQQGLDDLLTACKDSFDKTGKWNLIHAENMEELLNPEISDESVIHTMRDYMSAMPDYKSTFIFSTNDPSKLDYEAIQPHRVKTMDFSDIVTPKMAALEDAKARVNDKTARKETPLSTINDLLYIVTENPNNEIRWEDSMSNNVSGEVRSFIRDKLFLENDPNARQKITSDEEYEKIFDKLITEEEYQETLGKIKDPLKYKKAVIDLYNSRKFDEQSDSVKYMRVLNEAVKNVR